MKVTPMIFNAEMARALLDGRKTQTRRPMKIQPDTRHCRIDFEGGVLKESSQVAGCWHVNRTHRPPCGQPGDLIYVRETFAEWDDGIVYRASNPQCNNVTKWTPSIHMERKHSRLTLKITDVRIERVQGISEADAISEGLEIFNEDGNLWYSGYMDGNDSWFSELWKWHCNDPVQAFKELWDGIYFKSGNGWNDNPWVWCYTFSIIHKNVDEYLNDDSVISVAVIT